jgi:two-component system sensor histidine kinase QseC
VQTQVARLSNDPQMRGHALQQIESGVDRATHLVNQLLRLARLDPLSSLENRQAFDLHTVVNDALAAIRGANPDITQTIVNELPERPLLSEGDPDLLVIAVRNLIDNAIRYSGLASTIRITSVVDGSRCSLSVRDNGPGVPAAIQARLGERFFRNRETSVEGNGLGLAIVARIAELHGGSLAAGNLPEGGFAATLDRLHLATAIS